MTKITVLGGTGYAGGNIVRELVGRGHTVRSVSRHLPEGEDTVEGVEYVRADLLFPGALAGAVGEPQVVVAALAPRGPLDGNLAELYGRLGDLAAEKSFRLGVIGGAGSLMSTEGGPRLMDADSFPPQFLGEAQQLAEVLDDLRTSSPELDWFFVSPAAVFGAYAPGEALGRYRLGGDVVLADEDGKSFISGPDFAVAIVDEIEQPSRRRERFTVAY